MVRTTKWGNSTIYEYGEPRITVWHPVKPAAKEVLQTERDAAAAETEAEEYRAS